MSGDYKRMDRVGPLILRTLSEILYTEKQYFEGISGLLTFAAVQVSKDLKNATVYFTVLNGDSIKAAESLNQISPKLRSCLAQRIKLRTIPKLQFKFDSSQEYGRNIDRLIKQADIKPTDGDDAASQ